MKKIPLEYRLGIPDSHPGASNPPEHVLQDPDAREVISVWVVPEHHCPDCQETHDAEGYLAGDTTSMEPWKLGDMLARIAQQHAFFCTKNDPAKYHKMIGEMQAEFNNRLNFGMTKN